MSRIMVKTWRPEQAVLDLKLTPTTTTTTTKTPLQASAVFTKNYLLGRKLSTICFYSLWFNKIDKIRFLFPWLRYFWQSLCRLNLITYSDLLFSRENLTVYNLGLISVLFCRVVIVASKNILWASLLTWREPGLDRHLNGKQCPLEEVDETKVAEKLLLQDHLEYGVAKTSLTCTAPVLSRPCETGCLISAFLFIFLYLEVYIILCRSEAFDICFLRNNFWFTPNFLFPSFCLFLKSVREPSTGMLKLWNFKKLIKINHEVPIGILGEKEISSLLPASEVCCPGASQLSWPGQGWHLPGGSHWSRSLQLWVIIT